MLEEIKIEKSVYEIRSKQVMLDSDLAKLYGCTNGTKDIDKFNKQYKNLKIKYSNIVHDRFIIIDDILYYIGASLKDLGKKCLGINKIKDKEYLEKILSSIN